MPKTGPARDRKKAKREPLPRIDVSTHALDNLLKKAAKWPAEDRAILEGILNTLLLQTRMIYGLKLSLSSLEDYMSYISDNMDSHLAGIGKLTSLPVLPSVEPREVDKAIKDLNDGLKNNEAMTEILAKVVKLAATIVPLLIV